MLCNNIKELRISRGISQVKLAEELGVTKQSVSNWENDNIQPSIDMLIKISKFFSVSTDYLLGLTDRKTVDITGLSNEKITHLQMIIDDLKK